jgi:hypothetical protein
MMSSVVELFAEVPDSRGKHGRMYPLPAIFSLTVAAMMCGRTSLSGIARFARERTPQEMRLLGFRRCIRPAQNTLSIIFANVNVEALEMALSKASGILESVDEPHHMAMDGKRLCGSVGRDYPKGLHLISLFSNKLQSVLKQEAVEKGNEITAAITLLSRLDLSGKLITGDAIFAQREICRIIKQGGGDYLFALKGNQPSMHRAAKRVFSPECRASKGC